MSSHPPAHCCTVGHLHEGPTVGEDKKIGPTEIYITYPPDKSTTHGILIVPDVMGHKPVNVRLLADQIAAHGYFTMIVDPFQGDPCELNRPPDFDFPAWLQGPPSKHPETVDPIIESALKEMHTVYNVSKIGIAGYCFGGKYVARFLASPHVSTYPLLAGYTAHPSFTSSAEISSITRPLSIAAAEIDTIFPEDKRHETEAILKDLSTGEGKLMYQMSLYGGVAHGFATRGDLSDERQKWAKEAAFKQAVEWFERWVKGVGK